MEKPEKQRYAKDKPSDCTYCYFWRGKGKGCKRKECYYLLPDNEVKAKKPSAQMTGCGDCPYGKHSPCIGYCLLKIIRESRR